MPALAPLGLWMAVFTPMRRPALSSRGPPLLPGLMAASVWITPEMRRRVTLWISRPSAETTPVVRVWSRPKGLPMASTAWPTCRSALLPRGIGRSLGGVLAIWSTARSWSGALPTWVASWRLPSAKVMVARAAPRMTWKFVTTRPCSSQMKPVPEPAGTSTTSKPKKSRLRSSVVLM